MSITDRLVTRAVCFAGHQQRFVTTRAGRIHVLDVAGEGDLPPTVIIHGFGAAAAHYFPTTLLLRRHVSRIWLPDMPAHGLSDVPRSIDPLTIEAGLFEALDQVVTEPAVIIGNSMGGLAAIQYALSSAERVRALVLVSPAGGSSTIEELNGLRRTFELASHRSSLAFVDRTFSRDSFVGRIAGLRHVYAMGVRRKLRREHMRQLLTALRPSMLLPEELEALRMPTLLIWGRQDRILPRSHLAFFKTNLPKHAQIEEPEAFGHVPFIDHPVMLVTMLLRFLRAL